MAENYSQSVVRSAVGQICKSVGFDSISSSALEVLVDFAERHMTQIGRKSQRYAEQCKRGIFVSEGILLTSNLAIYVQPLVTLLLILYTYQCSFD